MDIVTDIHELKMFCLVARHYELLVRGGAPHDSTLPCDWIIHKGKSWSDGWSLLSSISESFRKWVKIAVVENQIKRIKNTVMSTSLQLNAAVSKRRSFVTYQGALSSIVNQICPLLTCCEAAMEASRRAEEEEVAVLECKIDIVLGWQERTNEGWTVWCFARQERNSVRTYSSKGKLKGKIVQHTDNICDTVRTI